MLRDEGLPRDGRSDAWNIHGNAHRCLNCTNMNCLNCTNMNSNVHGNAHRCLSNTNMNCNCTKMSGKQQPRPGDGVTNRREAAAAAGLDGRVRNQTVGTAQMVPRADRQANGWH